MSEFELYLTKKRIDHKSFKDAEPERFQEWESLFMLVHPKSFTQQKLFIINQIRRRYWLEEAVKVDTPKSKTKPAVVKKVVKKVEKSEATDDKPKPKFRPKVRPKAVKSEGDKTVENSDVGLKKVSRPVIRKKPTEGSAEVKKPARPVIKKKSLDTEDTVSKKEENVTPKKKIRPVIKPRKKD